MTGEPATAAARLVANISSILPAVPTHTALGCTRRIFPQGGESRRASSSSPPQTTERLVIATLRAEPCSERQVICSLQLCGYARSQRGLHCWPHRLTTRLFSHSQVYGVRSWRWGVHDGDVLRDENRHAPDCPLTATREWKASKCAGRVAPSKIPSHNGEVEDATGWTSPPERHVYPPQLSF